ncbi:uncharacterized protein LOC114263062 [Camellia sinensis]|uniref:uncharacterized protein LOC114263062 n=1 Tax=Camellia sinensis TaxID=4442 RepID=UPI001036ACE8|nr:uncharacterized protein LOC114263062 [Camellia sinensis]
MREYVLSAKVSVLVNGSPTSEFTPQRGLRQGDPLSLFLFNVIAEGLNILLGRALQMGLIGGAVVGSNDLVITHLQFANDTILFCEAEWKEIGNVKRILRCFEMLLGLKINYHKSVVCGIGISEDLTKGFHDKLNCLHQNLPLKYLGMSLGDCPRRRRMPEGVTKEIDRVQSRFLWRGDELRRKIHLVICGKFNEVGRGWWPEPVEHLRCTLIWKDILGLASGRPDLVEFFKNSIALVIGDGKRTLFWKDKWFGNVCLKDVFPRLYSVTMGNDEFVDLVYSRRADAEAWNLNFRRSLFQWEVEELRRMNTMLLNAPALREGRRDILSWIAVASGSFSVTSAYGWSELGHGANRKTAEFIWKNVSPPKVRIALSIKSSCPAVVYSVNEIVHHL